MYNAFPLQAEVSFRISTHQSFMSSSFSLFPIAVSFVFSFLTSFFRYGCPSMEELEHYNREYKKRLDEIGALGEIPDDLALEVSSPGAERILKVPDDLNRFRDMPMRVCYTKNTESNSTEKDGVFLLESIEKESEVCVWKLADVKENRDPLRKGRPLSRKQKDWRLELPFNMHRMVTLYLD
ncbi:hypothetical protein PIB30_068675 [Stylosanthes scabra]|uniref:DUF7912 domain-containing protein n=1 Tax=Stylosanthes scabra TaxID=79078 RepID=A0ABU6VP01_9FABA|nr:hypothetical protein [Stylosanthes scabra]